MQELKESITTKTRDQQWKSKEDTFVMNYLLLNWKNVERTILDLQQNEIGRASCRERV